MIYLCECCLQFSELSCIVLILASQQLDLGLEFLILLAAIGHSVFELFNVVLKVLYFLGIFHFHRLFHFLISFLESTSPLKATPMHFFYHPSLTCQSPSRVPILVFDIRTVTFLSIMKMNARVYLGICQKSYRWIKCYVCEKSNRAISVREQSLAQIILNSEGLRGFL